MMSFEVYKREFTAKALENGYSAENINKCLTYAEPLIRKGLPVIYNTSHLSAMVGYKKSYIKRAVMFPKFFYRYFEIPKKNGSTRKLAEPLPSLKEIQYWILHNILYQNKVSRYAKAYVPNRGIKNHVKYHTRAQKVLTLDIKNFFDSLSFDLTEQMFKDMGYLQIISNLLTKLCYLDGVLPQGAPTSPYITNILLYNFDQRIAEYCREKKMRYTRYADDLAFSGDIKKTELIKLVRRELQKLGLRLNNEKTRLMTSNQPQIISGLIVNDKVQVPKSERNKIRNTMYYIKKFGLKDHLEHISETRSNYLDHLMGKINYILSMNPKDEEFVEYQKYLHDLRMSDH